MPAAARKIIGRGTTCDGDMQSGATGEAHACHSICAEAWLSSACWHVRCAVNAWQHVSSLQSVRGESMEASSII